ncbi:MAG: nickel-responsive transcriptional regulator NikR [Candidatus Methanomethylophilaceae archaeon]|nr:nickel-responsive transcriptional regulator NikR [Candidatus Methanomethylophilaceae archaeon]
MDNVTRIGVSIEPELLDEFDELIIRKGYSSRSEALRDLVRDSLAEQDWKNPEQYMVGTITIIYDHNTGNISERLMQLQHESNNHISTSIHVHLDHDRCMEILLVSGALRELKELADQISSVRGVLRGRLTMASPTTAHIHHVGHRHTV